MNLENNGERMDIDFYYQDYETHILKGNEGKKDFIVCIARKI